MPQQKTQSSTKSQLTTFLIPERCVQHPAFSEELDNLDFHEQYMGDSTLRYLLYLRSSAVKVSNQCNSSLAYCLAITDDPPKGQPKYEGGRGLCDIDLDFDEEKRYRIIEYVQQKYGKDHVAHIGTFGKMKAKAAIRDVARTIGAGYEDGDKLAKLILPPIEGKAQPLSVCYESVKDLKELREETGCIESVVLLWAEKLEDHIRSAGTHASGIVISPEHPVKYYVPLYRGKEDEPTTQFDINDVERAGLVKFDCLGLRALTTIQRCLDMIEANTGEQIDLLKISVDDPEVYKLFSNGSVDTIFQFEGSSGIRELAIKAKPICLEDLSTLNAL